MTTLTGPALAAHEFLHDVRPEHIARLAKVARYVDLPERHRFFEMGERADRFWLVRTGRISLDLHVPGRGAVIIETLGSGTVLGWSWLFPPYEWRFGAVAVEPVHAIVLDGGAVRAMCDADAVLGYELTRRFSAVMLDRLQNTRLRLLDLYAAPRPRRP